MKSHFFLLAFLLTVTSCVPYKDMVLFRKDQKALPEIPATAVAKNADLSILPNDALAITITCLDPSVSEPFNLVDKRNTGQTTADSPLTSFLVDGNGDINFPILGKIQVAKKTIPQLRDMLLEKLKPYIKDPSVMIRRVNFHVTVLGEVAKAGTFTISSERITILEAIGMAGDFTPYSDRQRVMVVREENGKVTTGKVDLQTPDFFTSPYYFLHQNDVVYIDPKKNKTGNVNDPANKYISWGTATFSAVAAVATVFLLLNR
jgi:polysaccharide biosynthesis/export protein